jgi:hypothetical protein
MYNLFLMKGKVTMKKMIVIACMLGIIPAVSQGMLKLRKKKLDDKNECDWQKNNMDGQRKLVVNELEEAKVQHRKGCLCELCLHNNSIAAIGAKIQHGSDCICNPCLLKSIAALNVIVDQKIAIESLRKKKAAESPLENDALFEELTALVAYVNKVYKYKEYNKVCKAKSDSHVLCPKDETIFRSVYGEDEASQKTLSASASLIELKDGKKGRKGKGFDKN